MVLNIGNKKRRGLLSPNPPAETSSAVVGEQQLPVAPVNGRAPLAASRENTHITPIENHGQLPQVDVQRNLAVNERTGEVLDDDTGEVLTVTTTTTTVTKTETRRSRSPQPPLNGNNPITGNKAAQPSQQHYLDPSSALQSQSSVTQESQSSERIPSPSPGAINTATPQRHSSSAWPLPRDNADAPKSAIENLKSAAAGLHDVRNSLKGTLHTEGIPIPRRNPARGSRAQQQQQQQSPVPPVTSPAPTPVQLPAPPPPPPPTNGRSHWQAPWPEPEDDVGENEGLRKRKSLSSMPASFSPESSGQLAREKSPRLFKRAKNRKAVA